MPPTSGSSGRLSRQPTPPSWRCWSAGRRTAAEVLGRYPGSDAELAHAAAAPEVEVMRRMAEERVRSLCDRLVSDQRDVLLLRLVGGFTVEEVAAALGKSTGATKALQRRGLTALRKILERQGVPLCPAPAIATTR